MKIIFGDNGGAGAVQRSKIIMNVVTFENILMEGVKSRIDKSKVRSVLSLLLHAVSKKIIVGRQFKCVGQFAIK